MNDPDLRHCSIILLNVHFYNQAALSHNLNYNYLTISVIYVGS